MNARTWIRLLVFVPLGIAGAWSVERGTEPRWYRGNTHSHTLWSDGDSAPEAVVDWFVQHDYQFLVLSDHNVWLEGERWFPVDDPVDGRLTSEHVAALEERFGVERTRVRTTEAGHEMRLWTLDELRQEFESPGSFLLVGGEEITDGVPGKPVHVNGINLAEPIQPPGGATVGEVLHNDVGAVLEQGERLKRPVLAHVNHPNYGWALSADDLAELTSGRFVEIYNGHPGVRDRGDETHPSTEHLWDLANARRRFELNRPLLFGLATDDSHNYHHFGPGRVNPGRGWIMVRAEELTPDAIVEALRAGDFYASTGVSLDDVRFDGRQLTVDVQRAEGVTYGIRFVGCASRDGEVEAGVILQETSEDPAVYRVRGGEGFVRAVVSSSKPKANGAFEGEIERAWTRPFEVD